MENPVRTENFHAPAPLNGSWRRYRLAAYLVMMVGIGFWYAREAKSGHTSREAAHLMDLRRSARELSPAERADVYDEVIAAVGERDEFDYRELAEWARVGKSMMTGDGPERDALLSGVVDRSFGDPSPGLHTWGSQALELRLARTEEREGRELILDDILSRHRGNRNYMVQPTLCKVWQDRIDNTESPGERLELLGKLDAWMCELPSRDLKKVRQWMDVRKRESEAALSGAAAGMDG